MIQRQQEPEETAGLSATCDLEGEDLVVARSLWKCLDRCLGRGSYAWTHEILHPAPDAKCAYASLLNVSLGVGKRWLDAGCGHRVLQTASDRLEKELTQRVDLAAGCDRDLMALRQHRSLEKRVCCSLSSVPFRDGSFDVITLAWVVEHLESPRLVFAELTRLLRPDGKLIIATPNASSYFVALVRAGRLLFPESFVHWAVRFLEHREPADLFPAYYRANTRRRLSSPMRELGLAEKEIRLVPARPFFYFIAPLAVAELLLMRLLLQLGCSEFVAAGLLAVYSRSARAVAPAETRACEVADNGRQ